jgi:hypothetical protein
MIKLSPKQKRIVKRKIEGLQNKDIGKLEYPTATPASQAVLVSRELKKPNVAQYYEQGKLKALQDNMITWNRIIKPVSDALDATMLAQVEGDYYDTGIPNHTTRLSASKRAQELLESIDTTVTPIMDIKDLDSKDEVELQRIVFKKG